MKRNRFPSHPAIALLACAVLCGTLAHATKAQDTVPELKRELKIVEYDSVLFASVPVGFCLETHLARTAHLGRDCEYRGTELCCSYSPKLLAFHESGKTSTKPGEKIICAN